MIPRASYKRLYKLTHINLLDCQFLAAMIAHLKAMKRVTDRVAIEGKHYATIQRTIRGTVGSRLSE